MEYTPIDNLQNNYVPSERYIRLGNTVRIVPTYPQNRQSLRIEDLRNLKYVKDTSFRLIIEFKQNNEDTFSKYYTSEGMYRDLERGIAENNPFFSRSEIPTVTVYTDDLKETILLSSNEESSLNLELINNMGYNVSSDKFDYEVIVRYIDWLVEPSTLLNDTSLIPSKDYSKYELVLPK
jgi:hypothetical protein